MEQQQKQIFIRRHTDQSNENCFEKQFFPVFYNGNTFKIDPFCVSNVSLRFNELIKPYIDDFERMKNIHLEIYGDEFTKRSMNNFFCICHGLPSDVQDEEMKEICEIANMFKANEIYQTGLAFIQSKIDPNFTILDYKYDSCSNFMSIVFHSNEVIQDDINDIASHEKKHHQKNVKKKENSVIYNVLIEKHLFKSTVFKFFNENNILYTAKQNYNEIYIHEGFNVNFNKDQSHAKIIQNVENRTNTIITNNITFDLVYISLENQNGFSMYVSFPSQNKIVSWFPKQLKYSLKKDKYYLNFYGQYHRTPMMSPKNLVLQNKAGHPTFIVRKMSKNIYEFECSHNVEPLVAFVIGLSDIVGPYYDPWANISKVID